MHLDARSLTVTLDGVSRTADVSNCRLATTEMPDNERVLYGPTRQHRLQGTAAQDPTEDSLWDLAWSSVGELVEVVLRPAGGEAPTGAQPWFTGTVVVGETDGDVLGGEADTSPGARFVFDFDWAFTVKPTRVTDPAQLEEL